ncbi:hypothetical protein LKL35_21695 [Streptomyces sp. ET3-23]|uniref:hypothetical protein n=1 Tax=Streptomyces sp. ET3-23 TaxID=2885643 RepID=UPI001D11ABBE|nr:hypothetical protein [Streptomyces sp. ET3-23]MCC2278016.1 hypothetical protein [Streptomyces sp. ET3-23]
MPSENDIPDREESGLSTEDLAQPSAAREEAPVFPGEATEVTEATEDTGSRTPEATAPEEENEEESPRLLAEEDEEGYRKRWREIQSTFVDEPRDAVHAADSLVADVMQTLATTFADHKHELEGQWSKGGQVDTEDLRMALRRYRSFFNRLLST